MERSERDHQLQDTIPQHCGESATGRRSEWLLLQDWKNIPHLPWAPLHKPINTSSSSLTPTSDQWRRCAPGLPEAEKEKSTRPRLCYISLSEIMCWPADPHLHTDLQQITGTVRSPFMLQMLHHHLHPKENQNYRTKLLQTCGWKTGAGPPEGHYWTLAYRTIRSVDDAVNMGLYYVLQHLDRPGTYVRILSVDFSLAFNTIIPNILLS